MFLRKLQNLSAIFLQTCSEYATSIHPHWSPGQCPTRRCWGSSQKGICYNYKLKWDLTHLVFHQSYSKSTMRIMTTFSSSCHQCAAHSALSSKCPYNKYWLAITVRTCNPILRGQHPFTTWSDLGVYNAPLANAPQLMFDLTTAYNFQRAISIWPRDPLKSDIFQINQPDSSQTKVFNESVVVFPSPPQDPEVMKEIQRRGLQLRVTAYRYFKVSLHNQKQKSNHFEFPRPSDGRMSSTSFPFHYRDHDPEDPNSDSKNENNQDKDSLSHTCITCKYYQYCEATKYLPTEIQVWKMRSWLSSNWIWLRIKPKDEGNKEPFKNWLCNCTFL